MDTASPLFAAYIASAAVLGFNLLLLANNTALTRAFANEAVNPEDKKINAEAAVVFYEGNTLTQRYRRAHGNALENIPLFLITAFLMVVVQVPATLGMVLMAIFVVARLSHSLCYRFQLQPWRTASFAIGALDQLAILGVLVWYGLFA